MGVEIFADAGSDSFAIERQHYRSPGILALPVAGNVLPDNPQFPNGGQSNSIVPVPRIVRLHAPIETLIVKWTTVKEGAAPVVPNPYLFDKNVVFKYGYRCGAVPMTRAGYPGHIWSLAGEYHYVVITPQDLNSTMQLGIMPWEHNISVTDAIVPNVNFVNYLLELPNGKPPEPLIFQDPIYRPYQ